MLVLLLDVAEKFHTVILMYDRDGRISDPAVSMQPDFHNPAKSDSGRIACFTLDQTALITASTAVRQSATAYISRSSSRLSIWFAACVEWSANNYSNRRSRQVCPLRSSRPPTASLATLKYPACCIFD